MSTRRAGRTSKIARISNEKPYKALENDCDGVFYHTEIRGDITYTCCGYIDISARTFMVNGDGDKCPKCGAEITFSR